MDFIAALQLAKKGYQRWAVKDYNKRWVRRIDGTPIPNDLPVTIAEAIVEDVVLVKGDVVVFSRDWVEQVAQVALFPGERVLVRVVGSERTDDGVVLQVEPVSPSPALAKLDQERGSL